MDVDGFWAIIESARAESGGSWYELPDVVTEALIHLPPSDVGDFARIQDQLEWSADREDLWTASWLINAGLSSDDGFLYFRNWLLVQGRAVFEAALAGPDSLADVPGVLEMNPEETGEFADCEHFLYVAHEAWQRASESLTTTTGGSAIVPSDDGRLEGLDEELQRRGYQVHRDDPVPLRGEPVDIDSREAVVALLPRLGARFYERAVVRRRIGRSPR